MIKIIKQLNIYKIGLKIKTYGLNHPNNLLISPSNLNLKNYK